MHNLVALSILTLYHHHYHTRLINSKCKLNRNSRSHCSHCSLWPPVYTRSPQPCLFQAPHTSAITWCSSLCAWLIAHTMFSRFIHDVASTGILFLFYGRLMFYYMYIPHFSVHCWQTFGFEEKGGGQLSVFTHWGEEATDREVEEAGPWGGQEGCGIECSEADTARSEPGSATE